jgi:iron complex transport system substrate-binding protein
MKTKTLVLAGIAVCAILLTSPVLASAGYSKIYGNANEDDVLDMRDVTYIKLVIFGKKPATTLADANYDGKISMLDVGQTKLIILGKEKKLTLIDLVDRTVTINKPVERVVSFFAEIARTIVELGAEEKFVGIDELSPKYLSNIYPEAEKLPVVGTYREPNIELIVVLQPDVIFIIGPIDAANTLQEKTGIPVVDWTGGPYSYDRVFQKIELVATVLGKEKSAEELTSYFNEELDKVTEVTSEIPESEKPTVYIAMWSSVTKTTVPYSPLDAAGGINVARDCTAPVGIGAPPTVEVSKEQVIAWNPDIILVTRSSKSAKLTVEDVLSDPDLQTINAVKNHKVYYTLGGFQIFGGNHPRALIEAFYLAKLFHPEKFEELDMDKRGNEIIKMFFGVGGLYTKLAEECEYYRWE